MNNYTTAVNVRGRLARRPSVRGLTFLGIITFLEPLVVKQEGDFDSMTRESTLGSLRKMGFGTEPSKSSVSLHSICY